MPPLDYNLEYRPLSVKLVELALGELPCFMCGMSVDRVSLSWCDCVWCSGSVTAVDTSMKATRGLPEHETLFKSHILHYAGMNLQ